MCFPLQLSKQGMSRKAQREWIRSDLGPSVSFSQLMFRGIAVFYSLRSKIYTSEHSERRKASPH